MPTALRFCASIAVALSVMPAAHAQTRAPNPGTQTVLREWPMSGAWGVVLIRLIDGPLGCLMATAHGDQRSGEQYHWGLRWRRENVAAYIVDNNPQAVAGPSIEIIVDKIPVGTYQVNKQFSRGGFSNITAELPAAESDRLLSLVGVGGEMQYVTNAFTYSASLQGAPQALSNLKACSVEASRLDAAQAK